MADARHHLQRRPPRRPDPEIKETAVTHADGHVTVSRTPKVTGKCQGYFVARFLDGRITTN